MNAANARHASHAGRRVWISVVGAVACRVALGALIWQMTTTDPAKLWILAAMLALAVAIEGAYRLAKRELRLDA